jgi:predicted PolB exonuclease-like 3'-5' exonuclease
VATLVFDIETSALSLDNFDEAQQEYLFRECEKIADETAREARRAELRHMCNLWDAAKKFDSVVTFNGRGFDVPFIYLRSAILNVPISKKNWLGYRYATEPHCDLAEQLTFYSVSGRDGAARRFNLDFYCKSFGIESPKSHGVTGMDVNTLMAEKRFREIAEYCLRDVKATVELYKIWKDRLAGIK